MPTLFRKLNSDRCSPESQICSDSREPDTRYTGHVERTPMHFTVADDQQIFPDELPPDLQLSLRELLEDADSLGTGTYSRIFRLLRSPHHWIRIQITACELNPSLRRLEISRLTADELLLQFFNRQTVSMARLRNLSYREQHVLQLVAAGFLNKAIAGRLSLSCKTVEKHRSHAVKKLGLTCTPEVARFCSSLYWEIVPAAEPE
jgi:DNA-binding CsgD family transcriptional regulator